jgi:hypothetical protein
VWGCHVGAERQEWPYGQVFSFAHRNSHHFSDRYRAYSVPAPWSR